MSTTPLPQYWRPPPLIANARLRWCLIGGAGVYLLLALASLEVNWQRVLEGLPRAARLIAAFFPPDFTSRQEDIIEGMTVHEEVDEVTGLSRFIIVDSPDEKKQPTIEIKDKAGKVIRKYHMPSHAHLMVQDGETVEAGDVLAKIPRETTKTKDITGGLPRVVELFEARKPKDPAVISEIDGIVKDGGVVKGQRKMIIVPDDGSEPREYALPRGVHVNVHEGERVRAGEQLMDGPSNPHDILRVLGEKELQKYLVNEIQEVYRLQGVNINDKHIEVIARQMMRWVKIEDVGDTEFLIDEQVDKFRFLEENERVIADGGRPATAQPLLLGITKASLSTDSFISAASFQETTRVLTEASISGKIDHLRGLKENVTMGRLIPAGTGFEFYRHVRIPADEPPPPPVIPQPSEEDLASWFSANSDQFAQAGRVTIRHVYFDRERRGDEAARIAAEEAAQKAAGHGLEAEEMLRGDPFVMGKRLAGQGQNDLQKFFGPEFANQAVSLPAGSWQGPLESTFGS